MAVKQLPIRQILYQSPLFNNTTVTKKGRV
jgi:hypothetical protein